MAKSFIPYTLNQPFLLPLDLREWLPEDHLALFVFDVVQSLDLSEIHAFYEQRDRRGRAGYHPTMMVSLLVYAYCVGKPSSRKIEKATYEDVAFRVLSGNQHPDHDSIASFRQRHLSALASLFVQVLRLCQKAGLVKLGHVAIDGSKFQANASKHSAMSYERMESREKELKEEVSRLLEEAQRIDDEEDALYGKDRGDELPQELRRRESRLRKIEEAKAALEAEAKEKAEKAASEIEKKREVKAKREAEGERNVGGRPRVRNPDAKPLPTAQRNFTDPESRIMPSGSSKGSFLQGYNCQIAVDGEAQIILTYDVVQQSNDRELLIPMAEKIIDNCGGLASVTSADGGYFSEAAVTADALKTTNLLVPPNRKHTIRTPPQSPAAKDMRKKLDTPEGKQLYKMRKAIVEPVFGQMKEIRGYRRFFFRGCNPVKHEFAIISLTHNLLKLFRSGKHIARPKRLIWA